MFNRKTMSSMNIVFYMLCMLLLSCHSNYQKQTGMQTYAIRLKPGEDIKKEITALAARENIQAGWVASCAGSLTDFHIRYANQPEGSSGKGHFEIISLSGTVSVNGSHIHIGLADSTGQAFGGHLLDGNIIYTTAEIIIHADSTMIFTREKDGTTPWEELQIRKKN